MTTKSPTCILSGACLQGPQAPQRVSTISSEVENPTFYYEQCLYLQDQSTPPVENSGQCCPVSGTMSAVTNQQDTTDEDTSHAEILPQPHASTIRHSSNPSTPTTSNKLSKTGKACGWKTSKFFSKTMSSGEILRGLKKLSLSGSSTDPSEVEPPKPRKSKSGQLKKRSSCGNDEVTVEGDALAFTTSRTGGFPPLSKAISLAEPGSATKTSKPGIVCKKEDLKAILCSATIGTKKFPTASPTGGSTRAPLRQTKSASFEPIPEKNPIRRTGSGESRTRRNLSVENNEIHRNDNQEPVAEVPVLENLNDKNKNMNDGEEDTLVQPQTTGEGCLSTVKWDECEVVDAVLIGDAIETFLKGSMSGSEKRVSFRRNSSDKKAKSDG